MIVGFSSRKTEAFYEGCRIPAFPGSPRIAPCTLDNRRYGIAPGALFGTSGEFWLNLQKLYELRLAERKSGRAIARLPTLDAGRGLHATG